MSRRAKTGSQTQHGGAHTHTHTHTHTHCLLELEFSVTPRLDIFIYFSPVLMCVSVHKCMHVYTPVYECGWVCVWVGVCMCVYVCGCGWMGVCTCLFLQSVLFVCACIIFVYVCEGISHYRERHSLYSIDRACLIQTLLSSCSPFSH